MLPSAGRADAPGVPEDAQMVHSTVTAQKQGSSKGKGLCFRPVHVQNVHLLFQILFFLY